jgi:hypothetical protein
MDDREEPGGPSSSTARFTGKRKRRRPDDGRCADRSLAPQPELYGRMSAVAMGASDRVRKRIAKRPLVAESSVGAVHVLRSG